MDCNINPSSGGKYIRLEISGTLTRNRALKCIRAAHALGRERNLNRYLVDLTHSRNGDTILNNYDFAHEDMQQTPGIDRTAHMVLLATLGDNSHDVFETACQSAGLDVTLFHNRKQALGHLLDERPAPPPWRYR